RRSHAVRAMVGYESRSPARLSNSKKSLPVPWHLVRAIDRMGCEFGALAAVRVRCAVAARSLRRLRDGPLRIRLCRVCGCVGACEIAARELDRRLRRDRRDGMLIDQVRFVVVLEDDREVIETAYVAAQLEPVAQIDRDGCVFALDS